MIKRENGVGGNLTSRYAEFDGLWSPRSIAELNGQQVLLAKVKGNFI